MTASLDSCAEIKSAPSVAYVTKSGRVWRKVPESDARSVDVSLSLINSFLNGSVYAVLRKLVTRPLRLKKTNPPHGMGHTSVKPLQ